MKFELMADQVALIKTALECMEKGLQAAESTSSPFQRHVNGFTLYSIDALLVDIEQQEINQ